MFSNIHIIGLGLMGGSLAKAIRKNKLGKKIIGYDIKPSSLDYAAEHSIIDSGIAEINDLQKQKFSKDDLVILATPPGTTGSILVRVNLDEDTLLMDIGSTKGHLFGIFYPSRKKNKHFSLDPKIIHNFVPAHPVAGTENNGIESSEEDLFVKKKCLITPLQENEPAQVARAASFWQKLGSWIYYMDLGRHDNIFAQISHLPHLLAYSLMETLSKKDNAAELLNFSGGGLNDFARIAASDEKLWGDIFMQNRKDLIMAISDFQHGLSSIREKLHNASADDLIASLRRGRDSKSIIDANSKPSVEGNGYLANGNVASADANNAEQTEVHENKGELDLLVEPIDKLDGEIQVAADKSISHRSLILASVAVGTSTITNFLPAEDTLNSLEIMKSLGADISEMTNGAERNNAGPRMMNNGVMNSAMNGAAKFASPNNLATKIKIKGKELRGLAPAKHSLNCGNSGTAARLLCGFLSGQSFVSQILGDASLSKRPMSRVINPLSEMGGTIYAYENDYLPLLVMGTNKPLNSIEYTMPVASAQIKSALLLAALYADGESVIRGGMDSRDHTERMLKNFGVKLGTAKNGDVSIKGGQRLNGAAINIPADISSAAFFMVAASITPGSSILLKNVGVNPKRSGILEILRQMGGKIEIHNQKQYGNEPVADISVSYVELRGINIGKDLVELAIDEMPIIMIAAAYAKGTTKITGAEELRVKETDRIAAMVDGLKQIGVSVKETKDGAIIEGGHPEGGRVSSYMDHRIAMAFAIAACAAKGPIHIENCRNIATSFPNFLECGREVGMSISEKPTGQRQFAGS